MNKNETKNHFRPRPSVEVLCRHRSNSSLVGKARRHTKTGVVTRLTGSGTSEGRVVTRTPDRGKHVETCGCGCTVKS